MPIPIELEGDKPRNLKFNIAAVRDLEAAMDGKTLASIYLDMNRVGMTAITAALWAGLKHEDATLNLSLVSKMLDRHFHDKDGRPVKDGRKRLTVVREAIEKAIDETGLFTTEDDEGNAQAEPAAS